MKTRRLGKTGLEVSEVGIGCWQLGGDFGPIEDATGRDVLTAASQHGVTFFDTADVYGNGRSERLVAAHVASLPNKPIVATKVGRSSDLYPDGYSDIGLIEDHMKQSADRLGVDQIDLIQLHCIPTSDIQAYGIFDAMNRFQADGLVKSWGASVETIAEAETCIAEPGCATLQIIFNLFRQDAAQELFPLAQEQDVGIIVRLPLASGLLSGKMTKDSQFVETDHRNFNIAGAAFSVGETFSGVPFDLGLDVVDEMKGILPQEGTMAQQAIRWLLDHEAVSTVIAGASKPAQVRDNAGASDLPALSGEAHAALRDLYEDRVRPHLKVTV